MLLDLNLTAAASYHWLSWVMYIVDRCRQNSEPVGRNIKVPRTYKLYFSFWIICHFPSVSCLLLLCIVLLFIYNLILQWASQPAVSYKWISKGSCDDECVTLVASRHFYKKIICRVSLFTMKVASSFWFVIIIKTNHISCL